jgi:hypothetical protein
MKTLYGQILCIALIAGDISPGFAESAQETIRKNLQRDDGITEMTRARISSCRIAKKGKKIVCIEKPRTKVLEVVRKDYGARGLDTRQVMIIREPASEQGIGFLQYDYDALGKENDQWMYFSALGKVKRIVSGNEDEPKTGSFFGTELNYEDIEKRRLQDYTYSLLREEVYQNKKCRVIESIPTPKRARKSNYSKIRDWIDTQTYMRLRTVLFDRQGRQVKEITRSKIEKVNGVWAWRTQIVNNLATRRLSIFKLLSMTYNIPVEDDYLTQRALTDSAFRERHLSRYRVHLK